MLRLFKVSFLGFLVLSPFQAFALLAPYLISATAQTDSSILISWRNNDAASTGYIVQRRDTTATDYAMIDSVKSATVLTYTDHKGLKPSKTYTYQVRAYNASSVSDTSNSLLAITLAKPVVPDTFIAPRVSTPTWNYDTSKSVIITITDLSNCETGYRVYRDSANLSSFRMIGQIVSSSPTTKGTILFRDSMLAYNTSYRYKAVAYRATDSVASAECPIFTLHSRKTRQIAQFTRMGVCPISYGSWAARSGDSMYLTESNAPAGQISVININNATAPQFAGYTSPAALQGLPQQTLIPAYLQYGGGSVIGVKDRILVMHSGILNLYKVDQGNTLTLIDTCRLNASSMKKLDDSTVAVIYDTSGNSSSYPFSNEYLYPVHITATRLTADPRLTVGGSFSGPTGSGGTRTCYVRGVQNSQLIAMINYTARTSGSEIYSLIWDLNLKTSVKDTGTVSRSFSSNSGFYITPTLFIQKKAGTLYTEDITDLDGFTTATQSGYACITDSTGNLQNAIIDTAHHLAYVFCTNALSVYSYSIVSVGVKHVAPETDKTRSALKVLTSHSGATILLPLGSAHAQLRFYSISGRLLDRLDDISSNAVTWRPKSRGTGCYVISAKIGQAVYSERFILK